MKYIVISLLGLLGIILLDQQDRNLAFGMKLGESHGVTAYSSHDKDTCKELESTRYNGVYSGLKWQCVEYARRFMMMRYNVTFDQVDYAYQIFDLPYFISLKDGKKIRINKFSHGLPRVGDLIIWDRNVSSDYTGHVAVVVGRSNDHVFIAEQNWENFSWNNKNYSRKLDIDTDMNKIDDPHIIGWISLKN